ncbi:hypothetical protein FB451DRAFT_1188742 [Mycena latifolia]|nr:hypothetical protein FB451DRAFT_1188742 [Mycena latifolia]
MGPLAVDIDPYIEIWRAAEQAQFPVNPADTYDWKNSLCGMVDVGGKVRFARSTATTCLTTYMEAFMEAIGTRFVWRTALRRSGGTGHLICEARVDRRNHKKSIPDMAFDGEVGPAAAR